MGLCGAMTRSQGWYGRSSAVAHADVDWRQGVVGAEARLPLLQLAAVVKGAPVRQGRRGACSPRGEAAVGCGRDAVNMP